MPKQKRIGIHPIAEIFPPMDEQAYAALKADIEANGQREPITVHDGKCVDGRNRLNICYELKLKPKTRKWDGKGSLAAFVVGMNVNRRHLSVEQRAFVGAEIAKMPIGRPETNTAAAVISQEQAAAILNVSVDSVQRAATVKEDGAPELAEAVKNKEVSLSVGAAAASTLPTSSQLKALRRAEREGTSPTKELKAEMAKVENEEAEPKEPWSDFNESIRSVCTTLRGASRKLHEILQINDNRQIKSKWGHWYSYSGTVGALNAIVRSLQDQMPSEESKKPPGYIPARQKDAKRVLAK